MAKTTAIRNMWCLPFFPYPLSGNAIEMSKVLTTPDKVTK